MKSPQNVRALRLLACLEAHAGSIMTAKLWVDGLIKPVSRISSHRGTITMPITRYGMYYLRSSETMPDEIYGQCIQGEHVTGHSAGAWNGMWTDMMSDNRTNCIRYGKCPRGLIGITVKLNAMKT